MSTTTSGRPRWAVFLDRDGTLNVDPGYLNSPDELILLPGVAEELKLLKDAGYLLVVVTNQSGIGRGLVTVENLGLIHDHFNRLLSPQGAAIDHFEWCPHHPDDGCKCRKPGTELLERAAQEHGIDLGQSYLVGDRLTDMECGIRAGCLGQVLVRTGDGRETEQMLAPGQASFIADSLLPAAQWIVRQSPRRE